VCCTYAVTVALSALSTAASYSDHAQALRQTLLHRTDTLLLHRIAVINRSYTDHCATVALLTVS
jgi:hypothetical protein